MKLDDGNVKEINISNETTSKLETEVEEKGNNNKWT